MGHFGHWNHHADAVAHCGDEAVPLWAQRDLLNDTTQLLELLRSLALDDGEAMNLLRMLYACHDHMAKGLQNLGSLRPDGRTRISLRSSYGARKSGASRSASIRHSWWDLAFPAC